ncbi:carbonic anhydrase family protein [Nonlabens sp.]|uniref:carbonic anhydrase family protein n=1 Tax=Nonlabens sp. TaxID=1888209 RepID=UPI003F69DBEC
MKKTIQLIATALVMTSVVSCNQNMKETKAEDTQNESPTEIAIKSVLTAEEQASMTPDEIIGRLKKGNENFVNNNTTRRDHSAQRRLAAIGQYPKAIVLSCVDSRVPVEDIFDLGIGDIFVARVAGNIENKDIVGSMEFATAVAGSKVIVVLGHTSCGAVKHAIDNTDAAGLGMDNLQELLNEIRPVLDNHGDKEHTSKDTAFTNMIIDENVTKTVADIKAASATLNAMDEEGAIKIVGATYNMETGEVIFN